MKNAMLFILLSLSMIHQSRAQWGAVEDYYYYYPQHTDLYIKKADLVENTATCIFEFGTSKSTNKIFYSIRKSKFITPGDLDSAVAKAKAPADKDFRPLDLNNPLVLAFDQDGRPELQLIDAYFMVKGEEIPVYHLSLTYYPNEFYALFKSSTPRRIILRSKDLIINSSAITEWQTVRPPQADIEYAQQQWGPILKNCKSNYEKAKKIIRTMRRELYGKSGVPPDSLSVLHPFDQYDFTVNGKGAVWCTNTSMMFIYLANCLGIPARQVATGKNNINGDIMLWTNDGHTTTEIYDDKLNKWIWMDVSYGVVGVSDFRNHYLNVAQLCYAMTEKVAADRLRVRYYNRGMLRNRRLRNYKFETSIVNYFGRNQRVYFYHKDRFTDEFPPRVGFSH
jgi:hypothetical protein